MNGVNSKTAKGFHTIRNLLIVPLKKEKTNVYFGVPSTAFITILETFSVPKEPHVFARLGVSSAPVHDVSFS